MALGWRQSPSSTLNALLAGKDMRGTFTRGMFSPGRESDREKELG